MKFDKDAVLKHRFWIITGLSLPFAIVAILLLVAGVSADIQARRAKLKAKFDAANKASGIKTPEEIALKKVEADLLMANKDRAWKKAFDEQEPLFRWARQVEARFQFADGRFAREVNLLKRPADKKEWPEDKAGELLHGTMDVADNEKFTLIDRNGKTVTFHLTPELLKAGLIDQQKDKAAVDVKNLGSQGNDVLLAVGYQRARYFHDPLTTDEQLAFAKSYLTQIPPILSQIDPLHFETDEDGKKQLAGVVQLRNDKNWLFDPHAYAEDNGGVSATAKEKVIPPAGVKFLNFVADKWKVESDISEEAWIAQEDLWIQSEVFRMIRAANDSLGAFTEVSKNEKARTATYVNPYFKMALTLKGPKDLEIKVTNLLNRRQKIEAMKVRVRFTNNPKTPAEVFPLVADSKYADPLEPFGDPGGKHERSIPVRLEGSQTRTGIFGLEQVLTWETAAVKRLDLISIGSAAGEVSLSQKHMALDVRPYKQAPKKDDAAETSTQSNAPGTSSPGGGGGGGIPGAKGAGSGFGGQGFGGPAGRGRAGAAAGTGLANGLSAERYVEVTPQYRRIPVAVVLIVDQNQVDRVLTSFNNSRLRFLMNQVLLNHYPKSLKPEMPSEDGDDARQPNTPMGGTPKGGSPQPGALSPGPGRGPKVGPGMGSGFRPGMAGPGRSFGNGAAADTTAAPAVDELETNMELVLYGIVTLYERFPPRPGQPVEPPAEAAKK